jgi:hypothetical protein
LRLEAKTRRRKGERAKREKSSEPGEKDKGRVSENFGLIPPSFALSFKEKDKAWKKKLSSRP